MVITLYLILYLISLYFTINKFLDDFKELRILSLLFCIIVNLGLIGYLFLIEDVLLRPLFNNIKRFNIILYKKE